MEAAASQLTDIKFTERKRGYDPEEVDNFLERLGDAVVKLQEKVREANRRADDSEQRAAAAEGRAAAAQGGEDELTETLKKTLLLAQKTADQAVAEAKAEAEKLVTEAKQKAAKLLEDATRESAQRLSAAEKELKAKTDTATSAMEEQISKLEGVRGQLVGDVERLEEYLDSVRASVRRSVSELQDFIEHPEKLRTPERPKLEAPVSTPTPPSAESAPVDDRSSRSRPTMSGPTVPIVRPPSSAPPRPGGVAMPVRPSSTETSSQSERTDAGGGSAQDDPSAEDDGFLDALREAVTDETPVASSDESLGELDAESDAAMQAFFAAEDGTGDDDKGRPRFGRRR